MLMQRYTDIETSTYGNNWNKDVVSTFKIDWSINIFLRFMWKCWYNVWKLVYGLTLNKILIQMLFKRLKQIQTIMLKNSLNKNVVYTFEMD